MLDERLVKKGERNDKGTKEKEEDDQEEGEDSMS